MRQRAIGFGPGRNDVVAGDFAQHLADGFEQTRADDGVVLGKHAQGRVFLHDARQGRRNRIELVDVRSVGQHGARQGARLSALGLVGLVEEGLDLGVVAKHQRVEMPGDVFALLFEQRHGGLDEGDGLRRELGHVWETV
ncbi:hypothetical protein D9M68_798100 [compost metagenome]